MKPVASRSVAWDLARSSFAVLVATALNAIFLPRADGAFITNAPLAVGRMAHTATLLVDGKVLVAGGVTNYDRGYHSTRSTEVYDPAMRLWRTVGSLNDSRGFHTATLLPDGKVLVAGGYTYGAPYVHSSAEWYDPKTETWTKTSSMSSDRDGHIAVLLPNGKVLVAAGFGHNSFITSEIFDPATEQWTPSGTLRAERQYPTATLLRDGRVLVAAGTDGSGMVINTVELYDVGTGTWTLTQPLSTGRFGHTATLLANGDVLVAGGYDNQWIVGSAELYLSAMGTWTNTGSMNIPRKDHTATLLGNGQVLVVGGTTSTSMAELYDPINGTWRLIEPLNLARWRHSATLLPNGTVFIAGGGRRNLATYLSSCELYDPDALLAIQLVAKPMGQGGVFGFSFINTPGQSFTVLGSDNASSIPGDWEDLGPALEFFPGEYYFTDVDAPNRPKRFYQVRSP